MRRLGALSLAFAVSAIVAFAAFYGFVHQPTDGSRGAQVLYAATLLLPPALFLGLALVLLLRQSAGLNVLSLVAISIFVGSPTLVFFLGGVAGASLTALALALVGVTAVATFGRGAFSSPHRPFGRN